MECLSNASGKSPTNMEGVVDGEGAVEGRPV